MELNPFSYAFHENPYPIYQWLRDHAPVYRNDEIGFYALSRYDDVFKATVDFGTYSSAKGTVLEITPEMVDMFPIILFMDPPRHTRLRRLVSNAFTPRRIAALEPVARQIAKGLIDGMLERGESNFVRDFAGVLPIEMISILVGVPPSDRAWVRERTDMSLHREPDRPEFPESALAANAELVQYFNQLVQERRKQPRDDMTSLLLEAEVENDQGEKERLTDFEIVAFSGLLSGAGNETVTKLLGNTVVLLARHPDQRRQIVDDKRLIADAIEESLRYWPPAQYSARTLTSDVEVHGVTMRRDERVLLLTGSACRDERKYGDADDFRIDRQIPTQLAFGYGLHHCLGAALARLESRVSLEELHVRIPNYEIDESRCERVHMSNVHGFASVPMRW